MSSLNILKVTKQNQKDFEFNCLHIIVYVYHCKQDESTSYFTTDNNIIEQLKKDGKIKRLTHGLVIIID
jgi:dTDP-4-dehydrorhamnose reductase